MHKVLVDYDELFWESLYQMLLSKVRSWVYTSGVPAWRGQESDVALDVVHATVEKAYIYISKAQHEGKPVEAPERLGMVIAKNHYLDMRRREWRLQHVSSDEMCSHERWSDPPDPSEEAVENIYYEWLWSCSAQSIATFSKKIRHAILVDLANAMHFA